MPKVTFVKVPTEAIFGLFPVSKPFLRELVDRIVTTDIHLDDNGKLKFYLYCSALGGEDSDQDLMVVDLEKKLLHSVEGDDLENVTQVKAALTKIVKKLDKVQASLRRHNGEKNGN